jgi:hypothetical protein
MILSKSRRRWGGGGREGVEMQRKEERIGEQRGDGDSPLGSGQSVVPQRQRAFSDRLVGFNEVLWRRVSWEEERQTDRPLALGRK